MNTPLRRNRIKPLYHEIYAVHTFFCTLAGLIWNEKNRPYRSSALKKKDRSQESLIDAVKAELNLRGREEAFPGREKTDND